MINNLNQDDNDDDQDDNKDNAPASALGWVPLSARSEVIDVAAWELWLLSIARHHYWPTWLCCTKAGSTWRREGPTGQGGGRHDGGDQEGGDGGGDGHPSALLEGSTSLDKKSASSRSFSHLFALILIIFHTLAHSTTVSWFKCVSQGNKCNYQCYPSAPNRDIIGCVLSAWQIKQQLEQLLPWNVVWSVDQTCVSRSSSRKTTSAAAHRLSLDTLSGLQ